MLTLALSSPALIPAAVAYADSGPGLIVGHACTGDQPYVYPAARIPGWFGRADDLLICRIPETDLWVLSSDVEGLTTWDGLVAAGRPLDALLADQAGRLTTQIEVFENGDEDPEWPDPSAFDAI